MIFRCILVASFFVAGVAADYKDNIQAHIKSLKRNSEEPLCGGDFPCCNMSSTESCVMSSMPRDKSTLVLPGGDTRCIYSYSTPFAIEIIPGDTDKVLLFLQGNICKRDRIIFSKFWVRWGRLLD